MTIDMKYGTTLTEDMARLISMCASTLRRKVILAWPPNWPRMCKKILYMTMRASERAAIDYASAVKATMGDNGFGLRIVLNGGGQFRISRADVLKSLKSVSVDTMCRETWMARIPSLLSSGSIRFIYKARIVILSLP